MDTQILAQSPPDTTTGDDFYWPEPVAFEPHELERAYRKSAEAGNLEQAAVYADALLYETVSHTEDE